MINNGMIPQQMRDGGFVGRPLRAPPLPDIDGLIEARLARRTPAPSEPFEVTVNVNLPAGAEPGQITNGRSLSQIRGAVLEALEIARRRDS